MSGNQICEFLEAACERQFGNMNQLAAMLMNKAKSSWVNTLRNDATTAPVSNQAFLSSLRYFTRNDEGADEKIQEAENIRVMLDRILVDEDKEDCELNEQ